ncbi:MAG: hypothetical protein NC388_03210 [Clostridium sp.]|nr:hypothetical protein [Clostridium sp.]
MKFPDRESSFTPEEVAMMSSDDYFKRKREMDTYGGNLHVTPCFVYFYLLNKEQRVSSVLYNRKSGNVRRYEITELPPLAMRRLGDYYANSTYQHVLADSVLVKVLQPYDVIRRFKSGDDHRYYNALCEEDRRMLDSWTEESNPVLMLAKPRNF